MANIGLNVVEVDGKATPSIQPAPTSVAAFIIRAQRGVPGTVVSVTNWSQFVEHFGSYIDNAFGAYAVRGFFDNGGSTAFVTRVVKIADESETIGARSASYGADGDPLVLTAGYRGEPDPGTWGNALAVRITHPPEDAPNDIKGTYTLEVQYNSTIVETYAMLDNTGSVKRGRDPVAVINDPYTGSRYICVESADKQHNPDETVSPNPDEKNFVKFGLLAAAGRDDSLTDQANLDAELSKPETLNKISNLFDVYDVQLLCCPETASKAVAEGLIAYCGQRNDCLFVGHTEFGLDFATAKDYITKKDNTDLRGAKRYGAIYWPWIQVTKAGGGQLWIPPTGHIMGVYARTERERGIWKAPAGNAARLNGVLAVEKLISDADHTDLVKNGSINAIRPIPGLGIVIDSSRTLSTSPLWYYVNVRLLFNFVKSSLKAGLRWTVQEPNDEALWNKVKYNSVTPFLMGLWRRGAFGPGAPEDVFTVKIDAENNRPDDIQSGRLNIEVYFYPSRPAETILITVGQQEGAASASES